MTLTDELVTTCSCSVSVAVTFIVVQLWGIISNLLILIIAVRSKMLKQNTGKMLANEAVCDIFVNVMVGAMMIANLFNRRIPAVGVPVVISLSCVRAYCLLGVSFVLYLGICHSLKYRIYVNCERVIAYMIIVWWFVPATLLIIYLEGTFFIRKEPFGFIQANYTSSNWWVGAFVMTNACILPLLGIIFCCYKTLHYHQNIIFPSGYTNSGSKIKIRLAKLSMLIFVLHMLSQVPGHLVSSLHVASQSVVGLGYILMFLYPSCKFFVYLYMLRYFRKTAKTICRCKLWSNGVNVITNYPTNSSLTGAGFEGQRGVCQLTIT